MAKKEVQVTFRTVTPLWTGDAWQENREIRPSSLIGSLRFWFETICYFSGICKDEDFNGDLGRFEKEVNRENLKKCIRENLEKCITGNRNSFKYPINCLINCLKEQEIPLPSIIFGTTNWKSLIEIKNINYLDDYCFGNKLNINYAIGIKKVNFEIEEFRTISDWLEKINKYNGNKFKDKLENAKKEYSFFFFPNPYFYGNFQVTFRIEEEILESIFYPLLNFMDKYGYWGGKWNIGYGRLKIEKVEVENEEINNWQKEDFKLLNIIDFSWGNLINFLEFKENAQNFEYIKSFLDVDQFSCEEDSNFDKKILNLPLRIVVIKIEDLQKGSYIELIKELLKIKFQLRGCLRPNSSVENKTTWDNFRHEVFGERGKKGGGEEERKGKGSKILPFICEEDGQYKGGFLSIAGLLNLEKASKSKDEENEKV